jgi:hypothetical protein
MMKTSIATYLIGVTSIVTGLIGDGGNMNQKNISRLREAGTLIKLAVGGLDESGERCPTCGLDIKHNWPEARAAKWLVGLPNKLHAVCRELDGGE